MRVIENWLDIKVDIKIDIKQIIEKKSLCLLNRTI